jgi:hypothetical protein
MACIFNPNLKNAKRENPCYLGSGRKAPVNHGVRRK